MRAFCFGHVIQLNLPAPSPWALAQTYGAVGRGPWAVVRSGRSGAQIPNERKRESRGSGPIRPDPVDLAGAAVAIMTPNNRSTITKPGPG